MNIAGSADTPRCASGAGRGSLTCGKAGAFLGPIPLLAKRSRFGCTIWAPRPTPELNYVLSKAYGLEVDLENKRAGLAAIADALNAGDVEQAQRALSLLSFPDLPGSMAKRAAAAGGRFHLALQLRRAGILKVFDPGVFDSDKHPRWPAHAPDGQGGRFRAVDAEDGLATMAYRPGEHGPILLESQRQFFNAAYGAALRIAHKYGFNADYLLGLAAHKSHWFGDLAAIRNNNPLGVNYPGTTTLMHFDSIDAAFDYWGRHFGKRVSGSRTAAEFVAQLQAGPRGKYNSVDADYDNKVKRTIRSVARRKPLWLREEGHSR